MSVTKEQVLSALRTVQDPDLHKDIVTLGFVKEVRIAGGEVDFTIELTTPACPVKDQMKAEAEGGSRPLPGVTAARAEDDGRREGAGRVRPPGDPGRSATSWPWARARAGSGKSTTSVNLAVALARQGRPSGAHGRRRLRAQHPADARALREPPEVERGQARWSPPRATASRSSPWACWCPPDQPDHLARTHAPRRGAAVHARRGLGRARLPDRGPAPGHRRRLPHAWPRACPWPEPWW